jgi:DNA primase
MRTEGLSFPEAVERLAAETGVTPRTTPRPKTVIACEACGVFRGKKAYAKDLTREELERDACPVCSHAGAQIVCQIGH